MAGTLIVSNLKTDTDNSFIVRSNTGTTLFVANTTGIDVANSFASSSITSDKILSIANTKISGNIISSQITSVANTQITGTITGSQISSNTLSNTVFQTGSVENYMGSQGTSFGIRNKIINGAMQIDQRYAGAAFGTSINSFTVDRWNMQTSVAGKINGGQNYNSVTPPPGFSNYLGFQSQSAYTLLSGSYFQLLQPIEGYNTADFAWGTASAKTVTLSFWVYSSLTGTFGGALVNSGQNRSYPFTYTISTANTWEQKSITIPGDTSGSWGTGTGAGVNVNFGLGLGSTYSGTAGAWASAFYISATGATSVVSTNAATFYITGIQLEKGSSSTPFEYRPYGKELMLCQRYYQQTNSFTAVGVSASSLIYGIVTFPVTMRSSPSIGQTAALQITDGVTNDWTQSPTGISINSSRVSIYGVDFTGDNFSSVTSYRPYFAKQNVTGLITLSAEL